ncbi:GtrA family protein [Modestobacter excelsi]|uniref:GtrA family protein n=1 Tax=Modestobacter excelsi TaxID=2213161 RepID=UPI00110CC2D9|nr:GtrA family protein [Modestobacter excelsi]
MPSVLDRARRVHSRSRVVLKELSAFGVVGAACFVLDIGLFQLLYAHLSVGAVTAKLVTTLVSMTVAFFAHRHWSFSHRARTGVRREYSLFALVNGTTLLLGLAVVAAVRYPLGQDSALVLQIANVVSIVLCSALRYFSYKQWVFPAQTAATGGAVPVQDGDARIVA